MIPESLTISKSSAILPHKLNKGTWSTWTIQSNNVQTQTTSKYRKKITIQTLFGSFTKHPCNSIVVENLAQQMDKGWLKLETSNAKYKVDN